VTIAAEVDSRFCPRRDGVRGDTSRRTDRRISLVAGLVHAFHARAAKARSVATPWHGACERLAAMVTNSDGSRTASRPALGRRTAGHDGFTLIELLTVMAVLVVLAAIALQKYQHYRAAAYDATAMHDIGNAAVAQEAHYADAHGYVDFNVTGPAILTVPGLVVSETITLTSLADNERFTITATSSLGTGKLFTYESDSDTIRGD
jgi:prepilin-type N-terminal cleavage/methylation domain-containing protein